MFSRRSCQGAGRTPSGKGCRIGRAQGGLRNQVDDQAANRPVIDPDHEVFVTRRLPLALQVVAGLEDRPQRSVSQGRDADARDQPCDRGRLVQDDPDQLQVGRVEVALPDRGRARAPGGSIWVSAAGVSAGDRSSRH